MPDRDAGAVGPPGARSTRCTPPRRLLTAAVVASACALTCCRGSPEKELADSAERVASWCAAAEMAGESWQAGAVPRRYAEATAGAAQRGIEKERARLTKAPRTLSDARVAASTGEMSDLSALASDLWTAVRSGDRPRAAQLAGEIGARGRALRDASGGR